MWKCNGSNKFKAHQFPVVEYPALVDVRQLLGEGDGVLPVLAALQQVDHVQVQLLLPLPLLLRRVSERRGKIVLSFLSSHTLSGKCQQMQYSSSHAPCREDWIWGKDRLKRGNGNSHVWMSPHQSTCCICCIHLSMGGRHISSPSIYMRTSSLSNGEHSLSQAQWIFIHK